MVKENTDKQMFFPLVEHVKYVMKHFFIIIIIIQFIYVSVAFWIFLIKLWLCKQIWYTICTF